LPSWWAVREPPAMAYIAVMVGGSRTARNGLYCRHGGRFANRPYRLFLT